MEMKECAQLIFDFKGGEAMDQGSEGRWYQGVRQMLGFLEREF
ncbi:hypothetical protein [Liquorilactobacillus satsumensis]|nr:hypothetical protein [Liquorilactobacillus satsumensis]